MKSTAGKEQKSTTLAGSERKICEIGYVMTCLCSQKSSTKCPRSVVREVCCMLPFAGDEQSPIARMQTCMCGTGQVI